MQAHWHNCLGQLSQFPFGRPDRMVEFTQEAKAFRQIQLWSQQGGLELESELFRTIPAPSQLRGKLARRFKLVAARALAFLTAGAVPLNWRRVSRPATRLMPVFFERNLDCFFLKFHRAPDDDSELELAMHVITIADARDSLSEWSEPGEQASAGIDAAQFLSENGWLMASKLLPDNSRRSWERYAASTPLVPCFAGMLQRLDAP